MVWVIGTGAVGGGYGIFWWTGQNWLQIQGGAVAVSVGPGGRAFVINNASNIFEGLQ